MAQRYEDLIYEIESNISTDSIKYEGEAIWPLLRIMILYYGLGAETSTKEQNDKNFIVDKSWKARLGDIYLSYFIYRQKLRDYKTFLAQEDHLKKTDKKGEGNLVKADFLFLHYQSHRNQLHNGEYFNSFLHPLISEIEKKYKVVSIEVDDYPSKFRTPRFNKSFFIGAKIKKAELGIYKQKVKQAIASFFFKRKETKIAGFEDFKKLLPIDLQEAIFSNSSYVISQFDLIKTYTKVFENIIDVVRPKVMLQASYYHLIGLAMNRACHAKKVKSVDIQHGILEPLAYAGFKRKSITAFKMLPQCFWLWDKDSENIINKWSVSKNCAVLGGNISWSNNFVQNKFEGNLLNLENAKSKYSLLALITIQPLNFAVLPLFFLRYMAQRKDVLWMIRWHPRNSENDKESILESLKSNGIENYNVEDASSLPLSLLLPFIDIHFSRFSAVVFDAARHNLLTVFIDDYAKEIYAAQYPFLWDSGAIATANSIEEIEIHMNKLKALSALDFKMYFGADDYLKSINRLLEV